MKKKGFCLIMFRLFSLYAPVELTRIILLWSKVWNEGLIGNDHRIEIAFIWICYALMMGLFNLILYTKWEDR